MKHNIRHFQFTSIPFKNGMKVYLRYGMWSSRSYDYNTGEEECGVSTYNAIVENNTVKPLNPEIISQKLEGRFCFPVTGKFVGLDSDLCPCLQSLKVVELALHVSCKK